MSCPKRANAQTVTGAAVGASSLALCGNPAQMRLGCLLRLPRTVSSLLSCFLLAARYGSQAIPVPVPYISDLLIHNHFDRTLSMGARAVSHCACITHRPPAARQLSLLRTSPGGWPWASGRSSAAAAPEHRRSGAAHSRLLWRRWAGAWYGCSREAPSRPRLRGCSQGGGGLSGGPPGRAASRCVVQASSSRWH